MNIKVPEVGDILVLGDATKGRNVESKMEVDVPRNATVKVMAVSNPYMNVLVDDQVVQVSMYSAQFNFPAAPPHEQPPELTATDSERNKS